MLTVSRIWDVPGLLGRDLQKCSEFATEWLDSEALTKDRKVSLNEHSRTESY